jgi:hypothetical protein
MKTPSPEPGWLARLAARFFPARPAPVPLPETTSEDECCTPRPSKGATSGRPAERTLRLLRNPDGSLKWYCQPLNEPGWVPGKDAAHMRPDDAILGLVFGSGAWAIPWWVMKNHHVGNLGLDGVETSLTFCEACSSAAAWSPFLEGKRHTFRLDAVSNGAISPIDYETGSRWTGFTGECFEGDWKGRALARLPLVQCYWKTWLAAYPQTLVAGGVGEARDGHGSSHYPGAPMNPGGMGSTITFMDTRITHNILVLGVEVGGEARCYPLPDLAPLGPVLNDTLAGKEIAVFSIPGDLAALAFFRKLNGRILSFRQAGQGRIEDVETGSEWDLFGRAVAGPLKGTALEYAHSGVEEFYAWAGFHIGTEIWKPTPAAA